MPLQKKNDGKRRSNTTQYKTYHGREERTEPSFTSNKLTTTTVTTTTTATLTTTAPDKTRGNETVRTKRSLNLATPSRYITVLQQL